VPDFFIVGHPKSGTTALYEMLRRHPQIYMPDLKEPHFFAGDLRARLPVRPDRDQQPPCPPQTFAEYVALFDAARPQQRVGEASPSYLMSRVAAEEIVQAQPAARIIAILREPASFVRSLHMQFLQDHVETEKNLRDAIAKEDLTAPGARRPRNVANPLRLRYTDRVRYVEQLRRYDALFAPEQMLVLIYDDFRRDNEATVRRVLRFLEVDDTAPIEVVEANPTVRVRSVKLNRSVSRLFAGRGRISSRVKASVRALVPARVRRSAARAISQGVVYGEPRAPEEALMTELRRRYKPEVLALSEYLDRDLLSFWGYDDID
jgi:hypothetical protein